MSTRNCSSQQQFDVDTYLNRFIPRPRFDLLPQPISHFFGYRPPVTDSSQPSLVNQTSTPLIWLFAFLGGFIGIAIIENVYSALPLLDGHHVPIIIASFGAAVILEYNTVESPLAQPRNLVIGHFISAALAIAITKLFLYLPPDRFEALRWLAGALAVGVASTVMAMTKTVHPPAGATALLAATSPEITSLGWWLLPLILLGSSLMLASALIVNNLYRKFPIYWWTPVDLSKLHPIVDIERGEKDDVESNSDSGLKDNMDGNARLSSQITHVESNPGIPMEAKGEDQGDIVGCEIRINGDKIILPDGFVVDEWERQVLQSFQRRLQDTKQGYN